MEKIITAFKRNFEEFSVDMREEHLKKLNKNSVEYDKAWGMYVMSIQEILEVLPKEKRDLLYVLEEQVANMTNIVEVYLYQMGFKDGIKIAKDIVELVESIE